jgi:hypothetical protein
LVALASKQEAAAHLLGAIDLAVRHTPDGVGKLNLMKPALFCRDIKSSRVEP